MNLPSRTHLRSAFSLLEIIIATAVLAASAMVLTSLLGLGTKFGNRAEERTVAISQAQSLMDEVLALPQAGRNLEEELTGELPGSPSHAFRISIAPFGSLTSDDVATTNTAIPGMASESTSSTRPPQLGRLTCITVEIFESSNATAGAMQRTSASDTEALCRISRVIRSHRLLANSSPRDPLDQQVAP